MRVRHEADGIPSPTGTVLGCAGRSMGAAPASAHSAAIVVDVPPLFTALPENRATQLEAPRTLIGHGPASAGPAFGRIHAADLGTSRKDRPREMPAAAPFPEWRHNSGPKGAAT